MSTDKPDITSTRLTISVGATVSVNNSQEYGDWFRPQASYSIDFNGVPTSEQLKLATKFSHEEVIAPALEVTIGMIADRLQKFRRGE